MSRPRVIVTTGMEFGGHWPARDLFEQAGIEWVHRHGSPGWPDEETRAHLADVDGILAGGERFDAATMDHARRLKVIARNGVGYDRVDLDYCTQRGIVVTNTPGVLADAVADLALALLLSVVRHTARGDRTVKAGGYAVPMSQDLAAMTLGVIGCGQIGAETVRRALGFKMRVLAHDPGVDAARLRALGAEPVDLDRLLAESDAVSLHLPLTPASARLVDAVFLGRMKPGSFLINTARGGLVDEPALIAALKSGHLAGAGLDCQASEPPVGTSAELVALDNVVATPHCGSNTLTARRRMCEVAASSIVDVLQGRLPQHVVNRQVLARLDLK